MACASAVSPPNKLDGSHCKSLQIHHVVEIGPHSALQGPTKSILTALKRTSVHYLSVLKRDVSATSTLLDAVGYLWASGHDVDLAVLNQVSQTKSTKLGNKSLCLNDLPEYPFNHTKSYWHESQISRNIRMPPFGKHELWERRILPGTHINPVGGTLSVLPVYPGFRTTRYYPHFLHLAMDQKHTADRDL